MKRVVVVNFPQTSVFFDEVAKATAIILRAWGHTVNEFTAPSTLPCDLEIIFGSTGLPPWEKKKDRKYVYFNMEQLPQGRGDDARRWRLDELISITSRVDGILDISKENTQACGGLVMSQCPNVGYAFCPVGYHESFDHSNIRMPQTTDVLFIGLLNDRRKRLLEGIRRQGSVAATQACFGDLRAKGIAQARINLNLHVYDWSFFETLRIVMLFLASGRFCVSEKIGGWCPLVSGEHYMEWDQSDPEFFRKLLLNNTFRMKIARQGHSFVRSNFRYAQSLQQALSELTVL